MFRLSRQGWFVVGTMVFVFFLFYASNKKTVIFLHRDVVSIRKLLITCVRLAEDAGSTIRMNYKSSSLNTRVKDGAEGPKNELLTDIDLQSHSTIVFGLTRLFSGIKVISEEHPSTSQANPFSSLTIHRSDVERQLPNIDMFVPMSDLTVWVDPLDATQELTEGLLDYVTVMICVARLGRPIIGVIHQPFLNLTYWAWNSYGVSNDLVEALTNATRKSWPMDPTLTVTYSRSHLDDSTIEKISQALASQKVVLRPAGGSGYKVISLINGQAQLYVHPAATRRWDICAAQSVLESVGGRMTGLDGSQLIFDEHSPHIVPSTTGLFAASSVSNHYLWKDKFAALLSNTTR